LKIRGFFVKTDPFTDAPPFKMSGSPAIKYSPAPRPGRDNAYVYGELLGLSRHEIDKLENNVVI
jgi:crotonobetainyl-CoA:carnitine CoA-transferase CaiB-like acyl-CoA transferase